MTKNSPATCPLCGCIVTSDELDWSDIHDMPCCPRCREEAESCGCSDE